MTAASVGASPLVGARLPRFASTYVAVVSLVVAGLLALLLGWGPVATLVLAGLLNLAALPLWSALAENRRSAVDRLVTALVWSALVTTLAPLIWLIADVVYHGVRQLSWGFLTHDMSSRLDPVTYKLLPGEGLYHALLGTLLVTACAAVISIPIGLMTAIYLVEYGRGSRLARWITLMVDVMTGIPSIVAGLFALALFSLLFGTGVRMGFMGSVALSLLMIPTVVRSAEEMLRLVPVDLREAAYALGVPKWRTILKVVVRTSLAGIITGIMLAIARIIGETAPLLVAVGNVDTTNGNPFSGRMATLPVYVREQFKIGTPQAYASAWGAALLLFLIVMLLNLLARLIARKFAPKTGR
jgi:phosphate transport system permease protein